MSDLVIEKGVPIPPRGGSRYPLETMEIGDSFVTKDKPNRVTAITHNAVSRLGRRFVTRRQPDGSVRVWRTE